MFNTIMVRDGTSFWDLNRTINGNNNTEITLNKNYTYDPEIDSDFINGIIINRQVRINGNNNTINGLDIARIFQINANNVIINNINFTKGKANDGGAIYWGGNRGTISNSTFNNNTARNQGGAVYWNSMNGAIINSTFNNNTAPYGGAIYIKGTMSTVSNSTFNNNTADYGGAISGYGANGAISNSTFHSNNAEYGGAVNWYDRYGQVSSCLFINNTAIRNGSVYYNGFSREGRSNFTNNILLNNGLGEIYYEVFNGSNADYNWFGNNGSNYDQKPYDNSNTWLFINGTANPNSINISDISEITFKLYSYDGREIREYDNNLLYPINLSLSTTIDTLSKDTAGLNEKITFQADNIGNAIISAKVENVQSDITIEIIDGMSFWDLNRTINGNNDSEITLNQSYRYNPKIDSDFINGIIINRTVRINRNNNTINGSDIARIFDITGDNVVLDNIIFTNGNATADTVYDFGGTILWSGANGTLSNSTFNNNTAEYGGAIFWDNKDGAVCNSTFNNNNAIMHGGAINWNNVNGAVSNSTFNNNTAIKDGGAIL